jgi:hypothetical protein
MPPKVAQFCGMARDPDAQMYALDCDSYALDPRAK